MHRSETCRQLLAGGGQQTGPAASSHSQPATGHRLAAGGKQAPVVPRGSPDARPRAITSGASVSELAAIP